MKTLDPDALLGAPALPPKEWFEELPEWFDPDGPVIQVSTDGDDVGRVAVIVAPRNECLLDGTRDCWTAPESPSDYAWAHVGVTVTEDGTEVPTANIGGAVNHDTGQRGFDAAADHYANTATRLMRVAYFDAPDAVMAVGSMEPDVTVWDVLSAKASAVSGHWQPNPKAGNKVDFAGSQLVNNPGFRRTPKRAALTYVASLDGSDVSGVWTAQAMFDVTVTPSEVTYEIDGEPPDGAMVALITPLAEGMSEPIAAQHLTLAYLGKADQITPEQRAAIVANVAGEVSWYGLPELVANGVGYLGPNQARVVFVETAPSDDPNRLKLTVFASEVSGVSAYALEGSDALDGIVRHDPFLAHITTGYDGDLLEIEPGTPIPVEGVRVAFGTEIYDITVNDVAATAAQTKSTNAKENIVESEETPCACGAKTEKTETDPLAALTAQVEALTAKVAAYEVVDNPAFTESEQVTLPDGSFGSVWSWSAMKTADGVEMVQVTPEVNGELVDADAVLYPVDQLTKTGKRYQWVSSDGEDNDVIQASVVTAATVTSDELDAVVARMGESVSALTARVDEIEASVAELIIGDAPDVEVDGE